MVAHADALQTNLEASTFISTRGDFENNVLLYKIALLPMTLIARFVRQKRIWTGDKLSTNSLLFDGLGPECKKIKEGAATWRALEVIYNHNFGSKGIKGLVDDFWIGMRNAQAVRNRKKIIISALVEKALSIQGEIRILSLACGSAQVVLEAAQKLRQSGRDVKLLLIDQDEAARDLINHYAKLTGNTDIVDFKVENVIRLSSAAKNFAPNIVEMAGLMDYLQDRLARSVVQRIKGLLPKNGLFITCHIHNNEERNFLFEVINWGRTPYMLYRSVSELKQLIYDSGFSPSSTDFITEIHNIHTVVIGRV